MTRGLRKALLSGVLLALSYSLSNGAGQGVIGVSVPEDVTLHITHSDISFDLAQDAFPPPVFPAYFYPTSPREPIELTVFSNAEGAWNVSVDFEGLYNETANVLLSPDACSVSPLEYRVDGGAWLSLCARTNLIHEADRDRGYHHFLIEYRLRLDGTEVPGSYIGRLVYSLAEE